MSATLADCDLLSRLVGFDSTSSRSNAPIADFVCEYLDRPGIALTRQLSEDGGKVNVLALAGATAADRSADGLLLSGHLDCVPALEPDWTNDPFTLVERDGRWLARGACDMKGFIALAMNTLAESDRRSLTRPLGLLLTYDEELGSLGAQRFVQGYSGEPLLPRRVIVGEPTSLRAVRMHKGHLKLRLSTSGRAAHSGSPHLGANAIEAMAPILENVIRLGRDFRDTRTGTSRYFPDVPFPVLTVAAIRGGRSINVVPDRCALEIGVRVLPDMDAREVIDSIRAAANEAAREEACRLDVLNINPPLLLDESAPLHRELCRLLNQDESHGVSFASDGGSLSALGLDCVLFGPGDIADAHRPDEFVPIDDMRRARVILQQLVVRWCLGSE